MITIVVPPHIHIKQTGDNEYEIVDHLIDDPDKNVLILETEHVRLSKRLAE